MSASEDHGRDNSPTQASAQGEPAPASSFLVPGREARFRADLQRQLDEGATLLGHGEDGRYYAATRHGRRRVVPGTGGW